MHDLHKSLSLFGLLLIVLVSVSSNGQQPRFLNILPPDGLPIVPIMEGFTVNPDGTRSFSYGYLNRNVEAVDIPLGESNFLDPVEYNGIQPTHFPPGRGTGVFMVKVPADEVDIDVWWNLTSGDEEVLRVPGRAGRAAYELDFILPRPQGALQPLAGFGESSDISSGLSTSIRDYDADVQVASEVLLTVSVSDLSIRDVSDPRFAKVLPLTVTFNKYQGPGLVTFIPHPENIHDSDSKAKPKEPSVLCQGCTLISNKIGPNVVSVPGPEGLARVYASFSEPGNYIIHAKVDNFAAPDSSNTSQCCWTNIYQRINVTP